MTDDDWVTAAMVDTDMVAEVLVRLRVTMPPPPLSKRRRPAPPQSWTIHQRRSRSTQPVLPTSNKSETPRASPSTPLSWSGATSVSGGGGAVPIVDVVDSITQRNHNRSDISRSKVTPASETTPTKRPRKKKTLAALKEEEMLLVEEQNHLKRKLTALEANFIKQRKENESLKQIKLEIQQQNDQFEVVNERKDKTVLPDLNVPFGEDLIVSY